MSATLQDQPLRDGGHRLHLAVSNTLDDIPHILSALIRFCGDLGLDSAVVDTVALALDEAVSNVIRHGDASPDGISIEVSATDGALTIDVLDDGSAFDPMTLPTPDLVSALEDRKVGGLGIHFIRTLMDHSAYTRDDGRNHLRMVKSLRGRPARIAIDTQDDDGAAKAPSATDVFNFLGRKVSARLLAKAHPQSLADGDTLFRQGDCGECAYVVADGSLDVVVDIGFGQVRTATVGRNELIGELAVISRLPRSATVIARGPVKLLRIDSADLIALLAEDPRAARAMITDLGRRLSMVNEPLAFLSVAAQALRREDFNPQMMDAMAAKAATLGVFGRSLEGLLRQIEDNQVRRQEMAVAKHIQQSVLPKPLPDAESLPVLLDAFMRPTREVGGDLYDYFKIDDTHLALIIADVSGKGVPASLFMMRCRTVLHSLATSGLSVEQCVSRTNMALVEDNDLCIFVTLFFAVLDLETGRMTYCNAGHNPPYLLAADGTTSRLGLTGPAAAVLGDAEYETGSVDLAHGDLLVLYTDGITDALNGLCELYGEDRLAALLDSHRASPPATVVEALVAAVDAFAAGTEQYDDITCLAISRR